MLLYSRFEHHDGYFVVRLSCMIYSVSFFCNAYSCVIVYPSRAHEFTPGF